MKYSSVKFIPEQSFLVRDTDKSLFVEDLERLYIETKPAFPSFIKSDIAPIASPTSQVGSPFANYGAPPPNLSGDVIMPPDQERDLKDCIVEA